MKIPLFRIRASACSHITSGVVGLTESQQNELDKLLAKKKEKELTEKQSEKVALLYYKRDNPELPDGAKTYCKMWLKGKLFNRHVEIKSKYLEKGNIMEDNSLDEVAKRLGLGILLKNEKHFSNKWMIGTPDAIVGDCVIDVKNSWSWETLPLLETEVPFNNKESLGYYWQLQVYMAITKTKTAKLVYTLLDTPEHLIQNEAYWYSRKNGYGELTDEMLADFTKKMTYKDVPEKYKYKSFDIERNDTDIQLIKDRVIECREYIKTLAITFK